MEPLHIDDVIDPKDDVPPKLLKCINTLNSLRNRMVEHKKQGDRLMWDFLQYEKIASKYYNKQIDALNKKRNKPRGIAISVNVTPELCRFMGVPENTKMSRTIVNKHISEYINEHHLYDDSNKKIIIPDANLASLLGDTIQHEKELTRFTMQKYINPHFI